MTEDRASIGVYLSVCESQPSIKIGQREYQAGFRGKLESIPLQIQKNDTLLLDLSDLGIKPTVGGAIALGVMFSIHCWSRVFWLLSACYRH